MNLGKPRILIVEDDISSQQYYTIILEEKYELKMVSDVRSAKEALQEFEYGVAIIDISLSGDENGIDLIRFISKNYPDKPKCIALTAHAFPQIRVEALESGAAEYFTKPIMSEPLIKSVESHIQSLEP